MKKKVFKKVVLITLLAVLSLYTLRVISFGFSMIGPDTKWFTKHELRENLIPFTPRSLIIASKVIKTADSAMSEFVFDEDQDEFLARMQKKYGEKLAYYTLYYQDDAVSEKHAIFLRTAYFGTDKGVMWVEYYHHAFGEGGEMVYGSGSFSSPCLSRWELEKINDEWKVVKKYEGA